MTRGTRPRLARSQFIARQWITGKGGWEGNQIVRNAKRAIDCDIAVIGHHKGIGQHIAQIKVAGVGGACEGFHNRQRRVLNGCDSGACGVTLHRIAVKNCVRCCYICHLARVHRRLISGPCLLAGRGFAGVKEGSLAHEIARNFIIQNDDIRSRCDIAAISDDIFEHHRAKGDKAPNLCARVAAWGCGFHPFHQIKIWLLRRDDRLCVSIGGHNHNRRLANPCGNNRLCDSGAGFVHHLTRVQICKGHKIGASTCDRVRWIETRQRQSRAADIRNLVITDRDARCDGDVTSIGDEVVIWNALIDTIHIADQLA